MKIKLSKEEFSALMFVHQEAFNRQISRLKEIEINVSEGNLKVKEALTEAIDIAEDVQIIGDMWNKTLQYEEDSQKAERVKQKIADASDSIDEFLTHLTVSGIVEVMNKTDLN